MFNITAQSTFSAAKINKNVRFGTAVGLTRAAQQGQDVVLNALRSTFTLRGNWFEKQNKYGIKITPAKPDNLEAEVRTLADWLGLHETGGTKIPLGNHICIPTKYARPNPGGRIPAAFMPKALIASGKAFIETFKNGTKALSVHGLKKRGAYSDVVVMYILVPNAKIKKQSTFFDPLQKFTSSGAVGRSMAAEIQKALDNIK